jgi:plasmid stabilization system protein ParE
MRIAFRPEARAEVLEAKAWYEQRSPGLGLEFARAVDASISSAVRTPEAYPAIAGECRRVLLRRFPYSVIFRHGDKELLVVAVFHHKREPGTWLPRVVG